jgi:hypothetical protein
MLHMVLMTHQPDTCAAASHEAGEMLRKARSDLQAAGKRLQVDVRGWWVDPPAHVFFMLADAANGHVINSFVEELELFHWNTIDVHPVQTVDEALPLAAP